jgi:ankyrin repeat protein
MMTLNDVFKRCEQTGSWYGEEIASVHQRNFMSDTVLHTVCSWGDLNATKLVLAAGADVNAKGDQGATPLFNAVIGESAEVVKLLLSAGGDPSLKNDYGRLVADYAKNVSASKEITKLLDTATVAGRKRK